MRTAVTAMQGSSVYNGASPLQTAPAHHEAHVPDGVQIAHALKQKKIGIGVISSAKVLPISEHESGARARRE
jgi:hypothetical protein